MKEKYNVLAFDFGAGSGRASLCSLTGGKIEMTEVHRFNNIPKESNGTLYWDFAALFSELKTGLKKAAAIADIDSVGIDTWGVDFGLIGKDGRLLSDPVHYRDLRTDGIPQEVYRIMDEKTLYSRTGIGSMSANTVFQLAALKKYNPKLYDETATVLLMPDLFAYMLTGNISAEKSIASTTQLMNADGWDNEIISALGFRKTLFPKINVSGTLHGVLKTDLCRELGIPSIPLYNVCGHDTADAVFCASPETSANTAYISSGTWSLLGTTLEKPLINAKSFDSKFTNERGYNDVITYHKNIMGLWLLNECKREWDFRGNHLSYGDIDRLAENSQKNKYLIDVDGDFTASGSMPEKLKTHICSRYGAAVKTITPAETARCIYDSLAYKYKQEFEKLKTLTGHKYSALNIIGGGSKSALLCGLTAQSCGIRVIAGAAEAASLGNAMIQLIALGAVKDAVEASVTLKNSIETKFYQPDNRS